MPPRRVAWLAFGAWLASRGALPKVALVVTALAGVGCAAVALAMGLPRAAAVPTVASEVIAWGGGVMLAFGAALRAVPLDREQGVLALARARGGSLGAYVAARVAGLSALLAAAVGGATAVAALGALVASGWSAGVARSSAGALVFALVFALAIGPLAMAALGARTRAGGYLTLLGVLSLPELLAPWTTAILPPGWHELTSIPAALEAVRAGVTHPGLAGAHALRGLSALGAVVALSSLVVAARARPGKLDAGA